MRLPMPQAGEEGKRILSADLPETPLNVPRPPNSRKRQRGAADAVGDAAEASLLSPDKMQKVQGRVNASGIMVSVKDGRVLGKHLELKQLGFTVGYRNPKNTNT